MSEAFMEAAYRAITEYRISENDEPGRLTVSADWPSAWTVWGLAVSVDESLPSGSIVPSPFCRRHRWIGEGAFVSKVVDDGSPDAEGWQRVRFTDTKPGPRCHRCGVSPEEDQRLRRRLLAALV